MYFLPPGMSERPFDAATDEARDRRRTCVLPTVNNRQRTILCRPWFFNPTPAEGRPRSRAALRRAPIVPLRARLWLAGGTLATVGLVAALLATQSGSLAGAGSARSAGARITTASPAVFRRAMIARLHASGVNYQWVVCVRNGRRFEGVPVMRCNVEFGEPHVEAYCSVFRGGRLVTSQDDPAIPCAPDLVGYSAPIQTYN